MLRLSRKAQSTAEYAIVIGLVIAAAVAMQVYVKRGIQGRIRDAVNYVDTGDSTETYGVNNPAYDADGNIQYEVQYQTAQGIQTIRDVEKDEAVLDDGVVSRTTAKENVETKAGGTQTIEAP